MSPGRADREVLRRHLIALRAAVKTLKGFQGGSVDDLKRDAGLRWIVERGLQVVSQNALDLATHVAASAGRDVPDYATAIDVLGDLQVLPRDFAAAFRGVAGLRNVLVHGYLEVDLQVMHRVLQEQLGDFETFAEAMESLARGDTNEDAG